LIVAKAISTWGAACRTKSTLLAGLARLGKIWRLPAGSSSSQRLSKENQLGYKMAKWINRIEFVDTFEHIGKGQGGWRDDVLHYYPSDAGI
jgi:DMSO/TMAO reductase YedYZ molybdopterin-dependent catalytic subunit